MARTLSTSAFRCEESSAATRVTIGSHDAKILREISLKPTTSTLDLRTQSHARASVLLRISARRKPCTLHIALDPGSELSLFVITEASPESVRIEERTNVGTGATLRIFHLTLGGSLTHALHSNVVGDGGTHMIRWLALAQNHDRPVLAIRSQFSARDGGGNIQMRGIAADHAVLRCRAGIEVDTKAQGTHTSLAQHVLLLHKTASADVTPALEIKTNDVAAGHSATVTNVSAEDVFYMGSRGLSPEQARTLYIRGFLAALIDDIPHAKAKEIFLRSVERALSATAN